MMNFTNVATEACQSAVEQMYRHLTEQGAIPGEHLMFGLMANSPASKVYLKENGNGMSAGAHILLLHTSRSGSQMSAEVMTVESAVGFVDAQTAFLSVQGRNADGFGCFVTVSLAGGCVKTLGQDSERQSTTAFFSPEFAQALDDAYLVGAEELESREGR